jgi:hypothetical protein
VKDQADQALLRQAVANLRAMLTLPPHRPLRPAGHAVALARLAGEYSLARQLLDDWEKDALADEQSVLLSQRAAVEFRAGAYGPAIKAADEYLKRHPNDRALTKLREDAIGRLREQARPFLQAAPAGAGR